MTLPTRLEEILNRDDRCSAAANQALSGYLHWLAQSSIPFFPEYTDHGAAHVAAVLATADQVLATADQLIAAKAFAVLTPDDVACLIVAVLLHDVAMHLTVDGFRRLVTGKTTLKPIGDLGDTAWLQLWDEFRKEAARFSSDQCFRLFGEPDLVSLPDLASWNWNDKQKLLVGEFIRRHHPRLAHQIALHGFPGSAKEELNLDFDEDVLDIMGLVARSHGMDLRSCVDYLKKRHFSRINSRNIHAVFLMTLLRIADYVQIDAARSPSIRLRMQSLRSPVSKREHQKHKAVPQVTRDDDDPEALRVTASPKELASIDIYLSLKDLLSSIQHELDTCWAVLGEVYGLQPVDRNLYLFGLNIRRIRTNLETSDLTRRLPFEPVHLRFTSAEARLFKLLIGPLYSEDPNIGVRELVQNSMDAVRELRAYCQRHGLTESQLALVDQPMDVVVDLRPDNNRHPCLVVSDRGIGMTPVVIRNYFLRVGSSYRESSEYKAEFSDQNQRSTVLRTGYFGIGALAAFLIGDEIRVSTRHISSPVGFQFRATIDSDPIQLERVVRSVGTEIVIPLRSHLITESWSPECPFHLAWPTLSLMGEIQTDFYPDVNDPVPSGWQRLPGIEAPVLLWKRELFEVGRVTHNGFVVDGSYSLTLWEGSALTISCPTLHILDYSGFAGGREYLDLSRSEFFFGSISLFCESAGGYSARLLGFRIVCTPESASFEELSLRDRSGFVSYIGAGTTLRPWVLTKLGSTLLDADMLRRSKIRSIFFAGPSLDTQLFDEEPSSAVLLGRHLPIERPTDLHGSAPGNLKVTGSCVYLPPTASMEGAELAHQFKAFSIYTHGDVIPRSEAQCARLVQLLLPKASLSEFAVEWCLGEPDTSLPVQPNPLKEVWQRIIRQDIIPYDLDRRRSELAHAYEVLPPYNAAWEKLLAE